MVTGLEGIPLYGWGAVAGVVVLVWVRYVWPAWKGAMTSQSNQWRTESGFVRQLSDELGRALDRAEEADSRAEKANARAEASDRRADKYFMELVGMKTQVQMLTFQLRAANEKIDLLSARLDVVIPDAQEREDTKRVIMGRGR